MQRFRVTVTHAYRPGKHVVHFFVTTPDFLSVAVDHLTRDLGDDEGVVIVGRRSHVQPLATALRARGLVPDVLAAEGRLVVADADRMLERLVVDSRPDADAFDEVVGGTLRQATQATRSVRVLGEMVAALWDVGNCIGALELEQLWNGLRAWLRFDLLCCYPLDAQDAIGSIPTLVDVCDTHDAVTGIAPAEDRAERCRRFPRTPLSERPARAFVHDTLLEWQLDTLATDAELVVSELATNAMTHGSSDFTVSLSRRGRGVRIAVGDAARGRPSPVLAHPEAPRGRGLGMVGACARAWGHEPRPIGKLVWAHLLPS